MVVNFAQDKRRIDPKIEERASIIFNFYDGGQPKRVALPFFENAVIKESKRANYATYNPIGRSSSLFSYLGAQSREISISFNLTTPLIVERYLKLEERIDAKRTRTEIQEDYKSLYETSNNSVKIVEDTVERFYSVLTGEEQLAYDQDLSILDAATKTFSPEAIQASFAATPFVPIPTTAQAAAIGGKLANKASEIDRSGVRKGHQAVLSLINLIRASVVNNVNRPMDGPPIAILDYGVQYRNVPCIVQDYSIEFNDKYGYDLALMLPRVIECSLKLSEVRPSGSVASTGNQGYKIKGWESFLTDHQLGNNPELP